MHLIQTQRLNGDNSWANKRREGIGTKGAGKGWTKWFAIMIKIKFGGSFPNSWLHCN